MAESKFDKLFQNAEAPRHQQHRRNAARRRVERVEKPPTPP